MHYKNILAFSILAVIILLANPIKAIESNKGYLGIGMYKFPKARIAKEVTVVEVVPNSPAWDVGIRMADRILKVNGTDVSNSSVEDIQNLLNGNIGEKVTLTLKTASGVKDFTVTRGKIQEKFNGYPKWREFCGEEQTDDEICYIHADDIVNKLIEFNRGPFYVSTKGRKLAVERYAFENNLYLCEQTKDPAMCYMQIRQNMHNQALANQYRQQQATQHFHGNYIINNDIKFEY